MVLTTRAPRAALPVARGVDEEATRTWLLRVARWCFGDSERKAHDGEGQRSSICPSERVVDLLCWGENLIHFDDYAQPCRYAKFGPTACRISYIYWDSDIDPGREDRAADAVFGERSPGINDPLRRALDEFLRWPFLQEPNHCDPVVKVAHRHPARGRKAPQKRRSPPARALHTPDPRTRATGRSCGPGLRPRRHP